MITRYICENCGSTHSTRDTLGKVCPECGREICDECKVLVGSKWYVCTKCMNTKDIVITPEMALKLIACLNNSVYATNEITSKDQVSKLYELNEELAWFIANEINLDLNEEYVEPLTLKIKRYSEVIKND